MRISLAVRDWFRWWDELIGVWRDTRLIVLTAQIAAIYAAILIPFKAGVPIIPGFVELRPANAIPIVASLLFGPAAAWGAGIGNIIGDCFGTLGPASAFGFLGNFFYGYLPYVLWGRLGWLSSGRPPLMTSWRPMMEYVVVCITASAVCAGIIGWGVEWLGLLPFAVLVPAILINNLIMAIVLGPPLLGFLYPRTQRWQLRYEDIRTSVPFGLRNTGSQDPPDPICKTKSPVAGNCLVLECDDLSFQYASGTEPVLRDISFTLTRGEMVVLVGKSGSGKSTLCYTCNGLIPHLISGKFSGTLRVGGQKTLDDPVWKQAGRVGLVFQDFDTQLVSTTVEGELRHPLEYRGFALSAEEMQGRVNQVLRLLGLNDCARRDPMAMSGGQRQRLVMASVLVREPALLVLDEPGSDLDPAGRVLLHEVLRNLRREGVTVLMTEHDETQLAFADRLLVLGEGKIVWEGKPNSLLRDPRFMRQWGLLPHPMTESFEGMDVDVLPTSVEEGWRQADALNLTLHPPDAVLEDTIRLGDKPPKSREGELPLIHIENVSFQYEAHSVLNEVSFSVHRGDFLALLGQNGSGKSTLARLLNGLLRPTHGRILVDGMDTSRTAMGELAKQVGLVFQNPDHQIFADSVWEEVAFSPKNFGYPEKEITIQVQAALNAVGFPSPESHEWDPFSLRKGERQRIAVASVLATRPTVLIFDEPSTGLDADETNRMMSMIRELNRQGHTIVMITHSMRLVADYARRCLLMHDGRIIADGTPREIFADPDLIRSASLEVPEITRFSQRWGHTLLTVEEVRASFMPRSS